MNKENIFPPGTWIQIIKSKKERKCREHGLIGLIAEYDSSEEYQSYSIYFFDLDGEFKFRTMVQPSDNIKVLTVIPHFGSDFKIGKLPDVYLDVVEEIGVIDSKNGKLYIGSETLIVRNKMAELKEMKKRLKTYLK